MEINYGLKMRKTLLALCFLLIALIPIGAIHAQESPEPPTYVVQPGDTLAIIATRFGVSVNEIIAENGIVDPNTISINAELRIPGLEGIQGRLTTSIIPLGNNFHQLISARQLPEKQFVKLNRITSPAEIVAGAKLLMPKLEEEKILSPYLSVETHQSTLEIAAVLDQNPWSLPSSNQRNGSWDILPSEQVFSTTLPDKAPLNPVSSHITNLDISPLPLVQGQTTLIRVTSDQPITLTGSLAGQELNFYRTGDGQYVAIQGIYGREKPGFTEFQIQISDHNVISSDYAQFLLLEAGNFGQLANIYVDPLMVDPAVTEPEEELLRSITSQVTTIQYWDGPFSALTDDPCINAPYGTSRSYNNGAYLNFHTGIDFGVCAQNLNIYAPAAGVVVFAGPWTVRGNATVIDHGYGIYSGVWHQSEILVKTGDQVTPGMLIGKIGNTGRSTGPHLHWEIWVGGVQVNPLDWLNNSFP
ncbi:MAG: peptidoglycan DD-metalloendopeptidase family protein [Anaerolineaceae bacterium]|nr:peptidoglycan DD-metalloendopeptidase family protein [Anaerolineaceae bacterium]